MRCPNCKEDLQREGYVGAWFQLEDDSSPAIFNDLNVELQNNIWKESPDEERWICYSCDYIKEIMEEEK